MNKIDFSNLGGFPLEQDTLDFLQQSYKSGFEAVAKLCGNKTILSGVEVTGGNVSAGWISYNGELIKFISGAVGADVVLTETATQVTFEDANVYDTYFTRTATCGVSGDFPFSDLSRASLVPKGLISMWSGAINAIPVGWALCDGTNSTPDLKGKFIVGYDAGDADYAAIGKTGGEKKHTLMIDEMPKHSHSVNGDGEDSDRRGGSNSQLIHRQYGSKSSGVTGNNQAHENRPPYYTLAYIIKL